MKHSTWLLVTSHDNWDRFIDAQAWAFDLPTRLASVYPGDKAIVYLTQTGGYSALGGTVEFSGPITREKLASGGPFALHQHHAPIKTIAVLRSPIPFEDVRLDVTFLPDTRYWGLWLRGKPLKSIPPDDFELLERHILRRAQTKLASGRASRPT